MDRTWHRSAYVQFSAPFAKEKKKNGKGGGGGQKKNFFKWPNIFLLGDLKIILKLPGI